MITDPELSRTPAADTRCPHLVFRDVLGSETVASLLHYVQARRHDFTPATVRNRTSGQQRIDPAVRNCYRLGNLGPFVEPLRRRLTGIAAEALARLGLFEPAVEPSEFEICAYGDGGRFIAHIDTFNQVDELRILSCTYYFATTPRDFRGGNLRLYGLPAASARSKPVPSVDIVPETDTLVVFPSWLRHEVLQVAVPSGAWTDARFAVNCWIHRASPPVAAGLTT